jgi:hypothetical protein
VEEAVVFAVQTYGASVERFVSEGMLLTEYANYWHGKNQ